MADLNIDLEALHAMREKLVVIQSSFEKAEEIGSAVAGYVGHPVLAGVVDDFAQKWSVHRRELIARLTFIQNAVEAIHDTMVEVDQKLAASLEPTATTTK